MEVLLTKVKYWRVLLEVEMEDRCDGERIVDEI